MVTNLGPHSFHSVGHDGKVQVKRRLLQAAPFAEAQDFGGLDGDTIFAVATGLAEKNPPDLRALTEIGYQASHCLARPIARGVFEAKGLGLAGILQGWREQFGVRKSSI